MVRFAFAPYYRHGRADPGRRSQTPEKTELTPADSLLPTVADLRAVVSLGSDSSFDSQLEVISKAAQTRVNAILDFPIQGGQRVDYFACFSDSMKMTSAPVESERSTLALVHYSGADSNYGSQVTETIQTTGSTPARDGTYHYDKTGQRIAKSGSGMQDRQTASEFDYPVTLTYAVPAAAYDGAIRTALEQLVLALYSQRSGLEIMPGPVLRSVHDLLRPYRKSIF